MIEPNSPSLLPSSIKGVQSTLILDSFRLTVANHLSIQLQLNPLDHVIEARKLVPVKCSQLNVRSYRRLKD